MRRTTIARPALPVAAPGDPDPLGESIRRLGRKWTLLILRDLAFRGEDRFNRLLRSNPGLTPRVLSKRLREMAAEGLILRMGSGRDVRYRLTARGEDAVFILLAFLRYGTRHAVGSPPTRGARAV